MWTTGHLLTAARAGGTTQRPPRQQWLFSCLPSRLQSASWLHAVPENSDCKRERKGDSAFRAADAIATKPILCATHRLAECCARRARNRNAPIGTEAFYAAGSGAFPAAEAIATKPILCAVRNFASIADSVTITIALETIGLERAVVTSITQAVTITIALETIGLERAVVTSITQAVTITIALETIGLERAVVTSIAQAVLVNVSLVFVRNEVTVVLEVTQRILVTIRAGRWWWRALT